jgi:NADH:ubiquinone reductase (H+-translocating)
MADLPQVVIVGGGFGGLYAARALAHAPVRVTVVDRQNHHLFQPMLYQVAGAALNPSDIAMPIRRALRAEGHTEVILAEVTRIDPQEQVVYLDDSSSIKYDYCIVAAGVRTSYYGKDVEWSDLAPGLKTLDDALEIRRRVLLAFERAEREADVARRHAHLTFVVVGGGPTGVEVAATIAELRRYTLARDFHHIDSREATVMLLEGGPRILPTYPEHLSAIAKAKLRALGVDVREEMMVTRIMPGCIEAAGWTIPTHTVVWAAGMRASPLLETLGAPLDRMGRVLVEPDCTVPGHPQLFVIGDAAHFEEPGKGILPGVAQTAIQMGKYVGRIISGDLKGRPRAAFSYFDKGQLAVIGRGQAVAEIWKLHFGGFIAWFIWAFIHIAFLIGFRNRVLVMLQWAWSYFNYERGSRLITGANEGLTRHAPPKSAG